MRKISYCFQKKKTPIEVQCQSISVIFELIQAKCRWSWRAFENWSIVLTSDPEKCRQKNKRINRHHRVDHLQLNYKNLGS